MPRGSPRGSARRGLDGGITRCTTTCTARPDRTNGLWERRRRWPSSSPAPPCSGAESLVPVAMGRFRGFRLPAGGRGRRAAGAAGAIAALVLLVRFLVLPALPDWLAARDTPQPSDLAIALG